MRLPLVLTIFRMAMGPCFAALYLFFESWSIPTLVATLILLLIVLLCELTDVLDGVLARRRNVVTNMGKVLDPMADSFFRLSVFLTLTQPPLRVPLFLVLLFFWRDLLVNTVRTLYALRGIPLAARTSGKIKAVIQGAAIVIVLLGMVMASAELISPEELRRIMLVTLWGAAGYTLYSGIDYLWHCRLK